MWKIAFFDCNFIFQFNLDVSELVLSWLLSSNDLLLFTFFSAAVVVVGSKKKKIGTKMDMGTRRDQWRPAKYFFIEWHSMSCTIGSRVSWQSNSANIIIRQILPANFVDNSMILYYCYCFFFRSFCVLYVDWAISTETGAQQCMVGICHTRYSLNERLVCIGRFTSEWCIGPIKYMNHKQFGCWPFLFFFFYFRQCDSSQTHRCSLQTRRHVHGNVASQMWPAARGHMLFGGSLQNRETIC